MKASLKLFACVVAVAVSLFCASTTQCHAATENFIGKANAPVTIVEYASLTCSHCADFYAQVMPEFEKRYIETGKVRFIYRDFPMDAIGLRAATLAHCMPSEQFYPFIKVLFNNQASWLRSPKPEDMLIRYAEMAGLPSEKARTCVTNTEIMDKLIATQTEATKKYDIAATPTFIINDGEEKVIGVRTIEDLGATIDKYLAKKK